MPEIKINTQRLMDDLLALATFTEPNTPGWTRRFPSEAYLGARQWLRRKMEAEGLATHLDEAANLIGRLEGREARPPIFTGSHTDTVMGAGRSDGMLGVLGPLEAVRALREAGIQLRHPLCVVDYFAEEANDYAIACLGSLAIVGEFNREWLKRHVNGLTLERAIMEGGGLPERHQLVLNVCQKLEPRTLVLSSGAGHDTSYMAQIAPAAMIFVPSIDGRSHSPEENTLPEHLACGVRALAEAIVEVDKTLANNQ